MDVSLFDFDLPEERIALRPADPRDAARLLVVRPDGRMEHRSVRDLPDYLRCGDAMVANDTRVISARLRGRRLRPSGEAKMELLLHRRTGPNTYIALSRPAKKLLPGDRLVFGELAAIVEFKRDSGEVSVKFSCSGAALDAAIAAEGEVPLPPYIAGKRAVDCRDAADYQTVFARQAGSVAAPTAGLHFTSPLLDALGKKGVACEYVTLHVGLGTFLPVSAADTSGHRMHAERASLSPDVAGRLNAVHGAGGRILAVGTTSLRALESAADEAGRIHPFDGDTSIFIVPGYRFRAADALLTNFHLPRSTLFMLVCAFMGLEKMQAAYREAIRQEYRFYSYGDACLLLKST